MLHKVIAMDSADHLGARHLICVTCVGLFGPL